MTCHKAGPLVTVLMPVRNAAQYLEEAMRSLRRQTLPGFRILAIDDGSTDDSVQILGQFAGSNLEVVARPHRGLVATLNEGVALASTPYIARMDADDRSLEGRLEAQLAFLQAHPEHVLVGTARTVIGPDGRRICELPVLTEDLAIRRALAVANCFVHGSVMFRRETAVRAGGYRGEARFIEDYDLWRRLAELGKLANLPQQLYGWRANPHGESRSNRELQRQAGEALADEIWSAWFGDVGPAPRSVWPLVWPPGMDPRLAAELHLLFARGYLKRGARAIAGQHALAAWRRRPLALASWFYLKSLLLPAKWFLKLEYLARTLFERRRGW